MIAMDEVFALAIPPLPDARQVLSHHFLNLGRQVKRAASQVQGCMRMITVPSVGPTAALTFKAGVDDPARFSDLAPRLYPLPDYRLARERPRSA